MTEFNNAAAAVDERITFAHPAFAEAQTVEQGAPEPQPTPTPEPTAEKPTLFFGKYKTMEEAERGFWNNAQETQKIIAQRDALALKLAESDGPSPRVNPAERVAKRDHIAALTEALVPVDDLTALVDERAAALMEKIFGPLAREAAADSKLAEQYGDAYANQRKELDKFLAANPDVNASYERMKAAGSDAEAREWLFLKHEKALGTAAPPRSDASGQQQAEARAVAALSGSQAGTRAAPDDFEAKLEAALKVRDNTGNDREAISVLMRQFGVGLTPQPA